MAIDAGHTAWMLMSCGLVNLMTPGLAFSTAVSFVSKTC